MLLKIVTEEGMSREKWTCPKVYYKFIDPPGYDAHYALKSSLSMFSTYVF